MDNGADNMDSDIDQTTGETMAFMFETCNGPLTEVADAGYYQSGCIGGTYWHDYLGEGMFDGDDSGVDGGTVTISQGGGNVTDVNGNTVNPFVTGADGDYEFCDLPPGEYDISFSLPGGDWIFLNQNGAITDDDNNDTDDDQYYYLTRGQGRQVEYKKISKNEILPQDLLQVPTSPLLQSEVS